MLSGDLSDLICYVDRDEWNPYTTYQCGGRYVDTVKFEGYIYFCKKSNSNQIPNSDEDNEYWGLLSKDNECNLHTIKNDLDILKKLMYSLSNNLRTSFEKIDKRLGSVERHIKNKQKNK